MHKPVLQSLIIADHIYEDRTTGKKIISGTFNRIFLPAFPGIFRTATWAYLALTDFQGKTVLDLQFRNQTTQDILMKAPGIPINTPDRLGTHEVIVQIPGFPIPSPGPYLFEVIWENEMLGSLRMIASKAPQKGEGADAPGN